MRKLISTFLLSGLLIVAVKATVIFDPALVDTSSLPDGMEVVEIGGAKYLQVVLNGWNTSMALPSTITVPAEETKFKCFAMYAVGTSGFTIDQINTFIKFANSDWSGEAIIASASMADLTLFSGDFTAGLEIANIQFAGQETVSWSAVVGDTLTVGKIVTYNPDLIFEPDGHAKAWPTDGYSLVDIGGSTYLKVALDGWNTSFSLDASYPTAGVSKWNAMAKYEVGTSGFTIDQINTFIKLTDWSLEASTGAASTADFSNYSADIPEGLTITDVQLAGQETVSWGAVAGDTLYLGEISPVTSADANILFDPAKVDTASLPDGFEVVEEGGVKYLKITVDEWNTVLDINAYSMGDYNHFSYEAKIDPGTTGLTADQMNIFVQPMGEGKTFNISEAGSTSFQTFEGDALPNITVNQIQFAAQKNFDDWAAQAGAILYVSKITLSSVEPSAAPPRATYNAPYIPLTDYVDADGLVNPDEYWSNVTAANVDRQALPADETPVITDSKGTMKVAWDEYYLYVLIDAEDATPITYPAASTMPWENDGAELFMDMLNRRFVGQKRLDGQQHQVRFNLGRTDADTSAIMYSGVKELVIWGMLAGGNGWRLEVQIPWPNMCQGIVADEDIDQFVADSVKEGKKIGWEVSIINANAADTRNSIMNWANDQKADMAYNTNEFWGEITLSGAPSGIKSYAVTNLRIYPNPANEVIHVMNNNINSYKILDISGRTVAEGLYPDNGINISTLKSGLYFLNAVDVNNNLSVNKFLKR